MKRVEVKSKIQFIFFVFLVICTGQIFSAECGDVDSSGSVNVVDALMVAQNYVGIETVGFDSSVADVDSSGSVNIIDALMIAQFYVKLISSLECGGISTPTNTPAPTLNPSRTQAPYPNVDASTCGGWILKDNVCTARYCSDNLSSEDCAGCGGNTGALCEVVSSKASVSGAWPEVKSVSDDEPWHYSRSTHYGIGKGGACAFGLYNVCTSAMTPEDLFYNPECEAFCRDYPELCADPAGVTFRGNWAAPQGNYYTQFWPTLDGDRDNYLSCGECFEVVRTKKDGTDYQPGEEGYTDPVVLTVADSCPCSANSKWCCGAGRNHCYEVADFKYGCPLPPDPPAPADRDPIPEESIHIDLCSIAMARLQAGDPSGVINDGVIPIKYKRVPCPVIGDIHIWLLTGASNYYFSLSIVNVSGIGSIAKAEALMENGEWITLQRDGNYTSSRPQERYGTWVTPSGAGPFALPVSLRFTDPSGTAILAEDAIKAWTPSDLDMADKYFIDTGVQF